MVDLGKLTGYVVVEAALDEFFLEDTSHVAYVASDADWLWDTNCRFLCCLRVGEAYWDVVGVFEVG